MKDLELIQQLVGSIEPEQLKYVDYAVTETLGIFMPVAGQCYYAISPEHTHPSYLFTVAFDTYCKVRLHGQLLDSVPSTVTMLPPDIPHQELPSEVIPRYLAVMIDKEYFERHLRVYDRDIAPDLCGKPFPVTERLVSILKEFMAEYEEGAPGSQELLAATAQTITHLIIRILFGISKECEKVASRMSINKAIEYINSNYGEKITSTDMAHTACLSPSHFTRVFKAETGFSPSDYLMKTRLDYAKRMLRNSDIPLTQIALRCGFNSSSYFAFCFDRAFHTSPSLFRKSLQTA